MDKANKEKMMTHFLRWLVPTGLKCAEARQEVPHLQFAKTAAEGSHLRADAELLGYKLERLRLQLDSLEVIAFLAVCGIEQLGITLEDLKGFIPQFAETEFPHLVQGANGPRTMTPDELKNFVETTTSMVVELWELANPEPTNG